MQAVFLPLHVFDDDVVNVAQARAVFEHLPGRVRVEVDLDEVLVANGEQAVARDVGEDVVVDRVLVEVVTIDSKTCAACGYMVATANNAAKIYGDKVKVVERSIMFPENLAFVSKVGLTNLPSLLVNGVIKHISLIPTVEKLREEIEEAMK